MPDSAQIRRVPAVALCLGVGYATVTLNIAPLLIGLLLGEFAVSEHTAGLVLTLELLATALVALLLAGALPRLRPGPVLIAALLILTGCHAASMSAPTLAALTASRVIAGLATGVILGLGFAFAAASDRPVRYFGMFNMASSVAGIGFLFAAAQAIASAGRAGAYGLLVCGGVVCVAFAVLTYNAWGAGRARGEALRSAFGANGILYLVALLLLQTTQFAYFSFVEQLGRGVGLQVSQIGMFLSLGYGFAFAGAGLAAWMGQRAGLPVPLMIALTVHAMAVWMVSAATSPVVWVGVVFIKNFAYFAAIPFVLGIAARLDPGGRLATASVGAIYLGSAFGPLLGGSLTAAFGLPSVAWAGLLGVVLSLLLFGPAYRHSVR